MEIKVFEDSKLMSRNAAMQIVAAIQQKPNSLICIAGGDTPKSVCQELVKLSRQEQVSFEHCRFVSLDEWVGLDVTTAGSCIQTLKSNFFNHLPINFETHVCFFDGKAKNIENECARIHHFIEQCHGIDIIILGIGMNGHIGFIEPYGDDTSYCSVVYLAEVTRNISVKYFGKQPDHALDIKKGITLGVKHILGSKLILMMATGSHKAKIVKETCRAPISIAIPSTLIRNSQNAYLFLDQLAASQL